MMDMRYFKICLWGWDCPVLHRQAFISQVICTPPGWASSADRLFFRRHQYGHVSNNFTTQGPFLKGPIGSQSGGAAASPIPSGIYRGGLCPQHPPKSRPSSSMRP